MSRESSDLPLPPGNTGWPLLGETLTFLKDPFHFVSDRIAEHGPIFRTHLLGRDTIVIAGPRASARFIDQSLIQRDGAMPSHVQQFFGGRSLPMLDGDEHRARKIAVMEALKPDVLAGYIPAMQASIERAFERWISAEREIEIVSELKKLAVEGIGANIAELEPGPRLEALLHHFTILTSSLGALPIPVPGTTFKKALHARDAIFEILGQIVSEHRSSKKDDGLARILGATLPDGSKLDDAKAALELHHIFLAGYIVFGLFTASLERLAEHPDVRTRLEEEIRAQSPRGAVTHRALASMPYLMQVVKEVKRTTPIVFAFFGKAKQTFELEGYGVPEGWMVLWASWATNVFPSSFKEPHSFDPDRFVAGRSEDKEDEITFVPQGAGPVLGHRCAGLDYTTLFVQMFLIVLLRDHEWRLPEAELELDWSTIPPEPKDGLRVKILRRAPDDASRKA
jgi:retinoid hydroxylase